MQMNSIKSIMRSILAATALLGGVASQTAMAQAPYIFGLTTDNCAGRTRAQVNALASLPGRTMLRTVFDLPKDGVSAANCVSCIKSLYAVTDIMGQPFDSSYMKETSLD